MFSDYGDIHYFSVLSGPLLSLACASFICLIPARNTMKEPSYWYEDQLSRFMANVPVFIGARLVEVIYWSDFQLKKGSVLFLGMVAIATHFTFILGYYILWEFYLGFSQPMAFNFYFANCIAYIVSGAAVWWR